MLCVASLGTAQSRVDGRQPAVQATPRAQPVPAQTRRCPCSTSLRPRTRRRPRLLPGLRFASLRAVGFVARCVGSRTRVSVAPQAVHPNAAARPLANLGNTCYLNSVLQLLLSAPAFRETVLASAAPAPGAPAPAANAFLERADRTATAFVQCVTGMLGSSEAEPQSPQQRQPRRKPGQSSAAAGRAMGAFAPSELVKSSLQDPRTRIAGLVLGRQEDAADFLVEVLDRLCDASLFGWPNRIRALCSFYFRQTMQCECSRQWDSYQPATLLQLSLSAGDGAAGSEAKQQPLGAAGALTLQSLVSDFSSTLFYPEQFACPGCGQHSHVQHVTRVATAPQLLLVQLKRFESGEFGSRKLNDRVTLPTSLRHPVLGAGSQYQLQAVVRHSGDTMRAGHYTTLGTQNAVLQPYL